MAHTACHDIGSWVESTFQQPLEQCMEQDCNWWCLCCNKWFCWILWVVVTVSTWVVTTVCEIVADVIEVGIAGIRGLWDTIAGIFTGDWNRVLDAMLAILGAAVRLSIDATRAATGGSLVGAFKDTVNLWQLRNYANGLLIDKYGSEDPALLKEIQDALGISSGGFGLRLSGTAYRTYIHSDTFSQDDSTPDLIAWSNQAGLTPRQLAGLDPDSYWNRSRREIVGDAGDISDADFDTYVNANGRGLDVKHFSLFSLTTDAFTPRLDAAVRIGSQIGLRFDWKTKDVAVTRGDQVVMTVPDGISTSFVDALKAPPFTRHSIHDLEDSAIADLCHPVAIAVFGFNPLSEHYNGYSALMTTAEPCLENLTATPTLPAVGLTAATFRDRFPDDVFEYTCIHELGHTFGLCHVNGIDRIMYTAQSGQNTSAVTGTFAWQYWTSGEPGFILDEAKRVWDYIVKQFSPNCLKVRPS